MEMFFFCLRYGSLSGSSGMIAVVGGLDLKFHF
jgi:hypothetical protein